SIAWKDLERRVCRALGGQRAGLVGREHSDCTADVPFAVECKRSIRRGPPILATWVQQAREQSKKEGRPWLLVVPGHHDRHPIVAMEFELFVSMAHDAGYLRPANPDPRDDDGLTPIEVADLFSREHEAAL